MKSIQSIVDGVHVHFVRLVYTVFYVWVKFCFVRLMS